MISGLNTRYLCSVTDQVKTEVKLRVQKHKTGVFFYSIFIRDFYWETCKAIPSSLNLKEKKNILPFLTFSTHFGM